MVQPGVQYVTTSDGVSIAYTVQGEGCPIVHMQGPPFTHLQLEPHLTNYDSYNAAVNHGRRSIKFDSRGCGMSQRGIESFSIDALTEDLVAVVDRRETVLRGFEDPVRIYEVRWKE